MLICRECGKHATEEEWKETCSQMSLYGTAELICPDCGSGEIMEAQQCANCNTWCAVDTLVITADSDNGQVIEVCPECYDEYYFIPPKGDDDVNG